MTVYSTKPELPEDQTQEDRSMSDNTAELSFGEHFETVATQVRGLTAMVGTLAYSSLDGPRPPDRVSADRLDTWWFLRDALGKVEKELQTLHKLHCTEVRGPEKEDKE